MAINFIKNIKENKVDKKSHEKFIRYSLGEFEKENFTIKVGKQIQIQAGPEYTTTLLDFLASVADEDLTISGVITSVEDITSTIEAGGLKVVEIKRVHMTKTKKLVVSGILSPDKFRKLLSSLDDAVPLLTVKSTNFNFKCKASFPKPGKLAEKFVTLKFPVKFLDKLKEEFLFDTKGDFKKAVIKHFYIIKDVEVDEKLLAEDSAKARKAAVRVGKIKRVVTLDDGELSESEFDLKA